MVIWIWKQKKRNKQIIKKKKKRAPFWGKIVSWKLACNKWEIHYKMSTLLLVACHNKYGFSVNSNTVAKGTQLNGTKHPKPNIN